MSGRFQIFELNLRKRRRLWWWSVSDAEGGPIMEGAASDQRTARYKADRALFMLLLSAPVNARQKRPPKSCVDL